MGEFDLYSGTAAWLFCLFGVASGVTYRAKQGAGVVQPAHREKEKVPAIFIDQLV